MSNTVFTANEWLRYTRHIQLPQIGAGGQTKLKQSHLLIVGAGGLGSPVSLYLAAAGVGHITIVDGDHIDLTNLQRQVVFTTDQIGKSKAECTKTRLLALNPDIHVTAVNEYLQASNINKLFENVDIVIDCTDNFSARYLINDACLGSNTPWIFASIFQFSGQCALFTQDTACFRCLFPEHPDDIEDCNTAGVVGVLPGLLGTIQANEAIKYLSGLPCSLENHLLLVDAMDVSMKKIRLAKNALCHSCGTNKQEIIYDDTDCKTTAGNAMVSPTEFESLRNNSDYVVLDIRSIAERNAFHIGGLHIPLDKLESEIQSLDKDKMILSYCQTGKRCFKSNALLSRHGYKNKILQGGLAHYLKQRS